MPTTATATALGATTGATGPTALATAMTLLRLRCPRCCPCCEHLRRRPCRLSRRCPRRRVPRRPRRRSRRLQLRPGFPLRLSLHRWHCSRRHPRLEVPTPVLDVTSPTLLEPSMLPRGRPRLTPTTTEDTMD